MVERALPKNVQSLVSGYQWRAVSIGKSTARTFRFEKPGSPTFYLKMDSQATIHSLSQEKKVLEWLQGKLRAPQVIAYVEEGGSDYLLMSAVPGVDAATLAQADTQDKRELVRLLAQGLRQVHSLSMAGCSFDRTLAVEIEEAQHRAALGLVDPANFDPMRLGMQVDEMLAEVLSTRPNQEHASFTHGDYCLPNVIIQDGRVSGFVDWGRGGVGDPYKDIALAVRSIRFNLGPGYEQTLFDAYGLASPDWAKLSYFMLLDEFF
ncbi:MAG: aminoglycoside 3'-phosphotransferase [Chloroflexi bacterium]|nr:aminoglycoside 3'-phosphotransferase [Chloroflexota bacterium]